VIYSVHTAGCPSSSFMSVLQYEMLDITASQKFHVNMGPVLTAYGPMDVSCHNFHVCLYASYAVLKDLNELRVFFTNWMHKFF
jgi:hypothetical protein